MTWVESGTGGVEARTNLRGLSHWVRFDDVSPPLHSWCPSLPWDNSPTKYSTTLPYAAVASVMWDAFCNTQPDPARDKLGIFTHSLDVSQLNVATDKPVELGYSMEASSSSMRAAASMMFFMLQHAGEPAFVLYDFGVLEITASSPPAAFASAASGRSGGRGAAAAAAPAPASIAGRAPDHIDFCEGVTFGAARSNAGLYQSMIVFEVIFAPRILPLEWYDEGGQCMMAMDTLQSAVSEHNTASKPQVQC